MPQKRNRSDTLVFRLCMNVYGLEEKVHQHLIFTNNTNETPFDSSVQ